MYRIIVEVYESSIFPSEIHTFQGDNELALRSRVNAQIARVRGDQKVLCKAQQYVPPQKELRHVKVDIRPIAKTKVEEKEVES